MPRPVPSDEALIAATLELLGEVGPSVTTKAIAERADVNEVTLFRRFGGKDALFEAAIASAIAPFRDAAGYDGADSREGLVALAAGYASFIDANAAMIARVLPEVATRFADSLLPMQQALLADVRRLIVGWSALDGDDDRVVAGFIGPILLRATLGHLVDLPAFDAEDHVDRFLHGWLRSGV